MSDRMTVYEGYKDGCRMTVFTVDMGGGEEAFLRLMTQHTTITVPCPEDLLRRLQK